MVVATNLVAAIIPCLSLVFQLLMLLLLHHLLPPASGMVFSNFPGPGLSSFDWKFGTFFVVVVVEVI